MNSLERVRRAAKGDFGDRVPVGPYLASWTAKWTGIPLSDYCTDGQAMARAQLLAWEKLGTDIIFPDSDNYYLAEAFGCKTIINQNEIPTLVQPAIDQFEQVFDLEVPDPYHDGRMPVILEAIERIHSRVGDEVCIRVPGTGPFSVASSLVGVERFLGEMGLVHNGKGETKRETVMRMLDLTTSALIRFGLAELKQARTYSNVVTLLHRLTSFHQKCIAPGFYQNTSRSLRPGRRRELSLSCIFAEIPPESLTT